MTHKTVMISYLIIYGCLLFNLDDKPKLNKVLGLSWTVCKNSNPPNRKIIPNNFLDVIHKYNIERNWSMIQKEAQFLVYYLLLIVPPFQELRFWAHWHKGKYSSECVRTSKQRSAFSGLQKEGWYLHLPTIHWSFEYIYYTKIIAYIVIFMAIWMWNL